MKKIIFIILLLSVTAISHASSIFFESFEYANHDGETPLGWVCNDNSWLCGYMEKDHNRIAHTGDWYAYTDTDDSWMFMASYFNDQLKYRCSFWGISDGSYEVEFWAGSSATQEGMRQLLFSATVDSGSYDVFSEYIETITGNYDYFGIHAVAAPGAYHLSIDDISIEMIEKYAFHSNPAQNDTLMHAGAQASFTLQIMNDGYESLHVTMTPYTEYFTDIHFYVGGEQTNTFNIVQDEVVTIGGVATLQPGLEPGTLCWFDVMFTIDCGCATAMFTYWATVAADGIEENYVTTHIYPNPSKGSITVEGNGMIVIYNSLGQEVLQTYIVDKGILTLEKGIYFLRREDGTTQKFIVEF